MSARRTKDEIVASIDSKIAYHQDCIKKLEEKKSKILTPKTDARKIAKLIKESGLTMDEVAEKLGVKIEA